MTSTVAPTREDGVARAASEVVGGPAGTHVGTGRHGWWTAVRVCVAMATAVMGLAVLARQHCRATLWASPDQFTHACYSDLPALYASTGLDRGLVPYLQAVDGAYLSQPVGSGLLLWLLSALAPAGRDGGRWVFDLGAVLVAAALVACVVAVARLAGRRPWDAALVALSPVVLAAALVSLDLVAVALAVGGVLAVSRRRPVAAGVLLGLAVAVRPFTVLVLVAVALLATRAGRWRWAGRIAVPALLAWAAVNLPVLVLSPAGWLAYWQSLLSAPVGYGSLWLLPQLAGHPVPATVARWVSALAVVAVVAAVALVVLGAARRPRLPSVVVLLVAGVLVVSLGVPVQGTLLLLPFAALAVPRWRDLLIWGAAELVYATGTWLYLYAGSVPERGLPPWAYATLLVLRLAAVAWLGWQALRAVRDPSRDVVRSPLDAPGLSRDDPAAGDLEDAPDALVLRRA